MTKWPIQKQTHRTAQNTQNNAMHHTFRINYFFCVKFEYEDLFILSKVLNNTYRIPVPVLSVDSATLLPTCVDC